ncbi:hypothetical protein GCM10008955_36220 [Deinococcus malanensis]|uniref:Uncharacterized protein n=1 Tax=Deinococcus malanensis TaxID=1706855 RepID=A0ABQ2F1Q0_9DEIO|nr:hypothetical protein [Deinococcus malanensis]GGK39137.1 hypothetical protein GCM10008955_36220 [Deinococcus malanensis]
MPHLLRDLLNNPDLLHTPVEVRPVVEWEDQEWCARCEQYVPELLFDMCWTCLESKCT